MKRIFVLLLCFFILAADFAFAKKSVKPAPQKTEKVSKKKASRAEQKAEKKAEKSKKSAERKAAKPKKGAAKKASKSKKGADAKNAEAAAEQKVAETKKPKTSQSNSKDPLSKKAFENFSVTRGIVRLQSVMENGSILFFVENKEKKQDSWMPVVEERDLGESNYASLFIDGIEYRLSKSPNVSCSFEAGSDFVTITYKVKKIAEVKTNYVLSARNMVGDADCILVSYSILNRDKKRHDFALKAVYNTILGESRAAHFRTPSKISVTGEYFFQPSPSDNWIITSDGARALCFSLYGDEITPPGNVVMANKNIAEASLPGSVFVEGRSFTSVLAYNNSSLALFWEKFPVPPESEILYSYKINFSKSDFQNEADLLKPYEPPAEIVQEEAVLEPEVAQPKAVPAPEAKEDQIGFDTERYYLDPEKINSQYVQRLIDQINALEQTNPAVNRDKIQALQTEIDEILVILRSRR